MSVLSHIIELYSHMIWADAKVWEAILDHPGTHNDEKLNKVIYHLHLVQYAFFHIWLELPMEFKKWDDFETIGDLAQWAANYPELSQPFITDLVEEDLGKIISVPWSDRAEQVLGKKPEQISLAETMFQVITHSSYHRGQVNSRLRSMGADPPIVDFISWVWLGKPSAKWPV